MSLTYFSWPVRAATRLRFRRSKKKRYHLGLCSSLTCKSNPIPSISILKRVRLQTKHTDLRSFSDASRSSLRPENPSITIPVMIESRMYRKRIWKLISQIIRAMNEMPPPDTPSGAKNASTKLRGNTKSSPGTSSISLTPLSRTALNR